SRLRGSPQSSILMRTLHRSDANLCRTQYTSVTVTPICYPSVVTQWRRGPLWGPLRPVSLMVRVFFSFNFPRGNGDRYLPTLRRCVPIRLSARSDVTRSGAPIDV